MGAYSFLEKTDFEAKGIIRRGELSWMSAVQPFKGVLMMRK